MTIRPTSGLTRVRSRFRGSPENLQVGETPTYAASVYRFGPLTFTQVTMGSIPIRGTFPVSFRLGGLTLNHEPNRCYNPESVIGLVRNSGCNRITKVEGNGSSVAPWVTGNHPNAPSLLAHRITAITTGFEPVDLGSIPSGPV